MKAMLAGRSIDPAELEAYITDDTWLMQPKYDGHRVILKVSDGELDVLNRNGEISQHADDIKKNVRPEHFPWDSFALDCEYLLTAGMLIAFDCVRPFPVAYNKRLQDIENPKLKIAFENLIPITTAKNEPEKRRLLGLVVDHDGEGLMLHKALSSYRSGRSNDLVKCKFTKALDAVVMETDIGDRQSFSYGQYDNNGNLVQIGTAKQLYPVSPGDVVEVRYLHRSDSGRLVQPVLLRVRDDKAPEECTIT